MNPWGACAFKKAGKAGLFYQLSASQKVIHLAVEAGRVVNLEGKTDRQLLVLAESCADAFDTLCARYYDRVYQRVLSLLHDADLAQDVAGETFLRLFERRSRLVAGDEQLWPWLKSVAGNLARNEVRRRSRVEALSEWTTEPEPDAGLQDVLQAYGAEIRCAVHLLPPLERTCIRLHYVQGMAIPEIADSLHHSVHQVTDALHDSRTALRKSLAHLSPPRQPAGSKRKE